MGHVSALEPACHPAVASAAYRVPHVWVELASPREGNPELAAVRIQNQKRSVIPGTGLTGTGAWPSGAGGGGETIVDMMLLGMILAWVIVGLCVAAGSWIGF